MPKDLPDHVRVKVISNEYRTAVVEYRGKTFQVSDRCLANDDDIEVGPRPQGGANSIE